MKKNQKPSKKPTAHRVVGKILEYLKKPVTWVVTLALVSVGTAISTGAIDPFFNATVDRITRPEPVSVSNIRIHQHGATYMAFPPEVQISAADAAQVSPSDERPLLGKGGVRVGDENIQLTVTGNRTSHVRILSITPEKQCHAPLTGAYFESQPAGGDPSLILYMNIDDPQPQAMDKPAFVYGERTTDAVPYFDANTVSLAKDEQIVFAVNITARKSYCTFELDLKVLEDGAEHMMRINNAGKPFSITPQLEHSAWKNAYLGGVGCSQYHDGHYVPASADWVTGAGVGC